MCVLQVGMVFQSYALFNHLSVADNIKFGLQVRMVWLGQAQFILLRSVGLAINPACHQLSCLCYCVSCVTASCKAAVQGVLGMYVAASYQFPVRKQAFEHMVVNNCTADASAAA